MLNTEETIRFVTLRDVILMVKSKLLGADLKDAIEWLRKHFTSRYPRTFRKSNNSPMVFIFSKDRGYNLAKDDDVVLSLFSMALNYRDFFQESCFDTHGFDLEIINSFFQGKGIDIVFTASSFPYVENFTPELPVSYCEGGLSSSSDVSNCDVLFLNKFRDDDPLSLAIEIRNKEWASYDPNEADSRVKQESIVTDLIGKGFSKKQAESIELVACPIKRK